MNVCGSRGSSFGCVKELVKVGAPAIPRRLTTGCYRLVVKTLCLLRVRHSNLNKDLGDIDARSGATGIGRTERGKRYANFRRAVAGAIRDTRRQWALFQDRLLGLYGPVRGQLIVCALTKDDPVRDCKPEDRRGGAPTPSPGPPEPDEPDEPEE